MSDKPNEILEIEKYYDIEINESDDFKIRNSYKLNAEGDVICLNLSRNKISDISILKEIISIIKLDLSFNQISDISVFKELMFLSELNLKQNLIIDISTIRELMFLTNLNLDSNKFSNISDIDNLLMLEILDLSNNRILDLFNLKNLISLKSLDLRSCGLADISFVQNLKLLTSLNLWLNSIEDISFLKNLKSVNSLILWGNQISDINVIADLIELSYLDLADNKIADISAISKLEKIYTLDLSQNQITDIRPLMGLSSLVSLDLSRNKIIDISALKSLPLYFLNLAGNQFEDISLLKTLENISSLTLSNNSISDISVIKDLKKIKKLNLNNIQTSDFSNLSSVLKLKELSVSNNKITDISFLEKLTELSVLNLSKNNVTHLDHIKKIKKLSRIYLNDNGILDLEEFKFINELETLYITGNKNPCFDGVDMKFEENKNQYDLILNLLTKIDEEKKEYILPTKVLLLGNTGSGKSTLLDYLLQNTPQKIFKKDLSSTHIIQVETLPKKIRKNTIPQAVFYDFGGQDYYHGLYKAFLSNDSLNILLWNRDYDKNQIRKDRNEQLTRDYDRNYWLYQLKFQYGISKKLNKPTNGKAEPIILIQTRADNELHTRKVYKGDSDNFNIINEFYLSLNSDAIIKNKTFDIGLRYFEETLDEQIKLKQIKKNEPIWYKNFLNYILRSKGKSYTKLSDLALQYNRESDRNNYLLPEVLREIAQTGLILYYKEDKDLQDIVWLNPTSVIADIHKRILSKDSITKHRGIIDKEFFEKMVSDDKLIKLLLNQKVIFLDIYDNKYIIPGYLQLTEEDEKIYQLLTFDFIDPNFIMKFKYFIPFGLINQLICFYGQNNDKKYYWRDQLLFTKDNSKVLIKLDFTNLEISVYIKSKGENANLNKLEREIFKDILDLYWDKKMVYDTIELIEGEEDRGITIENLIEGNLKATIKHDNIDIKYESPDDLYISVDNKNFVLHKDLENNEKTFDKITSHSLELFKEIQNGKVVEVRTISTKVFSQKDTILFKNFTNNINAKNMKKIFISYSRKDVEYKDELKKHLSFLKTFDISDNWSCEEIKIGKWEAQIQKELEDSDLIIYMLSANFFTSRYILEKEVKVGMDLINENKGKNILCVVVSEFTGLDKLKNVLENKTKTILQDSLLNLSDYQYLPYDLVPNTVNNNNEEKIISLKEHTNRNTIEKALTQITERILEVVQVDVNL